MEQRSQIELRAATFSYPGGAPGASPALDGLSLSIDQGEYVCILGANGSGKSTLTQLMGALLTPQAGSVAIFGIDTAAPEGAATVRRRVATVFQHPDDQMVTSIVADDVAFGPENLGVPQPEIARRVDAALEAVGMRELARADPADLSGGQRQRVAIAGALAMEPKILLLDEPAAMLDDRGRHAIQRIAHRLHERGITIVHVTHFMDDALLAPRVVVLEHGRVALDGTPNEVFAERAAIRRLGLELPFTMRLAEQLEGCLDGESLPRTAQAEMLADELAARLRTMGADAATGTERTAAQETEPEAGASAVEAQAATQTETGTEAAEDLDDARAMTPAALSFHDVSFSYALERPRRRRRRGRAPRSGVPREVPCALAGVNFTVPAGSLTALIGHTGSGKSTTVELACALKLPLTGRIEVAGIDTQNMARRRALRAQIGYVSQFPERQLFAETVFDDVAFGPRNLGLDDAAVRERVTGALAELGLDPTPELLGRSPFALSGGQRRSVALAGVIAMRTPILILDEPMSGLDPAGRARMRALIERLTSAGTTILLVTHAMDDVAELADHVIALARGRVIASGTPEQVFCGEAARGLVDVPDAASASGPSDDAVGASPADGVPGLPSALAFARLLEARGVSFEEPPLTLDALVEEVRHGAAR